MGWEPRKETRRRYYVRSRWVNGRVQREYIGGGPLGAWAAEEDARERAEREAARSERRDAMALLLAEDAAYADFCHRVELLTRAALLAADYRRHTRGQWRKRRCA
jgi:hypothetical protein